MDAVLEKELKKIQAEATGEVARMIRAAAREGGSVVVELNGAAYAVRVEALPAPPVRLTRRLRASEEEREAIWKGYDPDRVLSTLDETVGSWSDIDTDELVANIYRWREEGSRPAGRS